MLAVSASERPFTFCLACPPFVNHAPARRYIRPGNNGGGTCARCPAPSAMPGGIADASQGGFSFRHGTTEDQAGGTFQVNGEMDDGGGCYSRP